jgi:hypothetical protein
MNQVYHTERGKSMKKDYVAPKRQQVHCSTYQRIDGEMLAKDIKAKYGSYVAFSRESGCSPTMVSESCRRNHIGKGYLTGICLLLGKPLDYYDAKEEVTEEPVKEEVTEEPVKEPDTFKADLFVELKKIEALLISINRKMDGKTTGFVVNK